MKKQYFTILFLLTFYFHKQGQDFLKLPENIKPEDRICFALYTVHENTLKLTAQFYPIKNYEPFEAQIDNLDLKKPMNYRC